MPADIVRHTTSTSTHCHGDGSNVEVGTLMSKEQLGLRICDEMASSVLETVCVTIETMLFVITLFAEALGVSIHNMAPGLICEGVWLTNPVLTLRLLSCLFFPDQM